MNKIFHQTKQAFFFSLAFYILSLLLFVFQAWFAPAILSTSILLSLVWTIMVLLEIMRSQLIDDKKRILLVIFIILLNILAGIVYFYFLRDQVIGEKNNRKRR